MVADGAALLLLLMQALSVQTLVVGDKWAVGLDYKSATLSSFRDHGEWWGQGRARTELCEKRERGVEPAPNTLLASVTN